MIRPIEIKFVHGWGFDQNCWNDWQFTIDASVDTSYIDRGYSLQPQNQWHYRLESSFKVLVVHSLGLHFVPIQLFSQVNLLVLVSSFLSFLGNSQDQLQKRHLLRLMQRKLTIEPACVLTDFYKACGLFQYKKPSLDQLNIELLLADLNLLENSSLKVQLLEKVEHKLLLHGTADSIVSTTHSQRIFDQFPSSNYYLYQGAMHGLPILQATWCSEIILDTIALLTK